MKSEVGKSKIQINPNTLIRISDFLAFFLPLPEW